MEAIARLYRDPLVRGYVRGKLRDDPVFPAAFDLLKGSLLPVLDLGCGMGLLQFYLRERGYQAPLVGVDFDARKIRRADRVGQRAYRELTFTTGDASAADDFSGHVVMLDMLHYLDAARQAALLERVAGQIAPGGYCLVRDTLRDGSWRFRATAFGEFFIRAITWQKTGVAALSDGGQTPARRSGRGGFRATYAHCGAGRLSTATCSPFAPRREARPTRAGSGRRTPPRR